VQNAHLESFNSRLRDEWLNADCSRTLADAQRIITHFQHTYTTDRPSGACWPLTPAEYARTFSPSPL
jgi:putative transposase